MLSVVFYALTPPTNWKFSGPRWNIPFWSNQVMHLELFGTVSLSTTMKDQNQSNNFLHVCLVTIRQLVWLCDSNTNYHVAALSKGGHQQKITWTQLPPHDRWNRSQGDKCWDFCLASCFCWTVKHIGWSNVIIIYLYPSALQEKITSIFSQ